MEERLEHSGDGHRHSVVNSGGLNSGGLSDRDARSLLVSSVWFHCYTTRAVEVGFKKTRFYV